jgi:hypothetical protein
VFFLLLFFFLDFAHCFGSFVTDGGHADRERV